MKDDLSQEQNGLFLVDFREYESIRIGVDLGKTGGIVVTSEEGKVLAILKMSRKPMQYKKAVKVLVGKTKHKVPKDKFKIVQRAKHKEYVSFSHIDTFFNHEWFKSFDGVAFVTIENIVRIPNRTTWLTLRSLAVTEGAVLCNIHKIKRVDIEYRNPAEFKENIMTGSDKDLSILVASQFFEYAFNDHDISEAALLSHILIDESLKRMQKIAMKSMELQKSMTTSEIIEKVHQNIKAS